MEKININEMAEGGNKIMMDILAEWMYMYSLGETNEEQLIGFKKRACKDFLHVNNKYYYKDNNIGFIFVEEDENKLPIVIDKVTDEQELNLLSMIY